NGFSIAYMIQNICRSELASCSVWAKLSIPFDLFSRSATAICTALEIMKQVNSRSEEHTSELQSLAYLVCRLLLEKKKTTIKLIHSFFAFATLPTLISHTLTSSSSALRSIALPLHSSPSTS